MAHAVVAMGDVWEGRDVSIDDVLNALQELRRRSDHGAVRTSVLTLVVILDVGVEPNEVFDTIHRLGSRHPSRTIICRLGEGTGIDARVGVHDLEREGSRLALDDIVLDIRGAVVDHLDSVVAPLVLPDLPVVLWHRDGVPPADDPRLNRVTQVIVDTERAGGVDALPAAADVARRLPLNDLAWVRLLPLREHLTALLRAPHCQPFLAGITHGEVRGAALTRALLGGWLDDRLGLGPGGVRRVDDDDRTAIVLDAEQDGHRARFEVSTDGALLRAVAEIDGETVTDLALTCPDSDEVGLLGRALVHLRRDRVYEAAIARA